MNSLKKLTERVAALESVPAVQHGPISGARLMALEARVTALEAAAEFSAETPQPVTAEEASTPQDKV